MVITIEVKKWLFFTWKLIILIDMKIKSPVGLLIGYILSHLYMTRREAYMNRKMDSFVATGSDSKRSQSGFNSKFAVVREEVFFSSLTKEDQLPFDGQEVPDYPEDLLFEEGYDFISDDETDPDEKILGI